MSGYERGLERRVKRFNATTGVAGYMSKDGALLGANFHPDRCKCNGRPMTPEEMERVASAGGWDVAIRRGSHGDFGDTTPHKHDEHPPYSCARCSECKGYDPAEPLFAYGECDVCRGPRTIGEGVPIGIECGECRHHFHIGAQLLAGDTVRCPRCEAEDHPVHIVEVQREEARTA